MSLNTEKKSSLMNVDNANKIAMTMSQFSKVNAFVPHQVIQLEVINLNSFDLNEKVSGVIKFNKLENT